MTPRPLRVGDRVRSLVSDGVLVSVGLTGLVVNVVHPSYGGARARAEARVKWDNDTTSLAAVVTLQLVSEGFVLPVGNTLSALSPGGAS